jgi:hypothetical protein
VESFFNRLASYFMVDVDMPMDLGDGNQLETGCGGGQCPLSAIRFRTAAHAECIWHVKGQHKVHVGLYVVEFLCRFVSRLMGQV